MTYFTRSPSMHHLLYMSTKGFKHPWSKKQQLFPDLDRFGDHELGSRRCHKPIHTLVSHDILNVAIATLRDAINRTQKLDTCELLFSTSSKCHAKQTWFLDLVRTRHCHIAYFEQLKHQRTSQFCVALDTRWVTADLT